MGAKRRSSLRPRGGFSFTHFSLSSANTCAPPPLLHALESLATSVRLSTIMRHDHVHHTGTQRIEGILAQASRLMSAKGFHLILL